MATIIEMPKLSDTMEEGGIANWLKKEGDAVKEGEPLVEIETDKATQEYESPAEGVLLKIVVNPGKTVALRTPIAVIGEKGEKVDLAALGAPAAKAPKAEAKPAAKPAPTPATKPAAPTPAAKATHLSVAKPVAAPVAAASGDRVRSSPLARKMAADAGLDLGQIQGSGPGGRIVQRDIEAAAAGGSAAASGGAAEARAPADASGDAVALPVSMMRKTIAKRLLAAKNDAPHFYLTISADMARAMEWRKRLNEDATAAKVSVNDLVLLACGKALLRHPMVNSSWQGDVILQNRSVHVAMAVALPEGLVTPVIRNTDKIGLREIATQARELATRAKDGKLGNHDYTGGTFTVSNLGMFGIESFTAIINPPQAAILAVGATQAVPAVDAKGQLVVQQRMTMTLSCDHRVVDGATGAQFLQTLVKFLEDPMAMLA